MICQIRLTVADFFLISFPTQVAHHLLQVVLEDLYTLEDFALKASSIMLVTHHLKELGEDKCILENKKFSVHFSANTGNT